MAASTSPLRNEKMMASGCGRTCLPDAMRTIESHLKSTKVTSNNLAAILQRPPPRGRRPQPMRRRGVLQGARPSRSRQASSSCVAHEDPRPPLRHVPRRVEYKLFDKGELKLEMNYLQKWATS
mmetsp:Transcript_13360/g.26885  ORF Transcript_13360/g.26885 Transcript_13360/m.26885 type:complete len:123 (+) Transcript_13360:510-878(+)